MISTQLHWIDGPWPGRIALSARPRGGDWLNDEIKSWQRQEISAVVSLLTREEEIDLDIAAEATNAAARGMKFHSFPLVDRQVPDSADKLTQFLRALDTELEAGSKVVIHCRQGVGRAGLVAACLLVMNGVEPDTAMHRLSAARGVPVPETPEQERWISEFARRF